MYTTHSIRESENKVLHFYNITCNNSYDVTLKIHTVRERKKKNCNKIYSAGVLLSLMLQNVCVRIIKKHEKISLKKENQINVNNF